MSLFRTPEELADLREELREHRPRLFRCVDGFCGAEDCARCHPEIEFRRPDEQDEV